LSEEIYALDLDEELLSHLVREDSWLTLQGENFDPELINDEFVAEVYGFQRDYRREHKQLASPTVVADHFDLDLREPDASVGYVLDQMRLRYMRNGGREHLKRIVEETRNGDPLEVPGMLLKAGRDLSYLLSRRGEIFGTGDYERAMHRYEQKAAAGPGASFGYEEIDAVHNGMHGLNVLLGYKKSSKSWQMLMSMMLNAEQGLYPWLYSLELPADETDMRFRCLLADVPWWKYVHNALGQTDKDELRAVSELIDSMAMYKIVKPPSGSRDIHSMVNTARDAGAGIVLIDQLQYVEGVNGKSLGRGNDTGEYFGVLNDARDLSDEGPIYIAHQFGRQAAFAEEMPDVSMAKSSSAIEEVATVAMGIWSNKDMRRSGKLQMGTLISRNSAGYDEKWEIDMEMSRGCSFEICRRLEDDNE
jgi:DnaB helicase-like protein